MVFTTFWHTAARASDGMMLADTPQSEITSYYKTFFPNMWFGTANMANKQNFVVLLLGTVGTMITMFRADDNVVAYVNKHPRFLGSWANLGNSIYMPRLLGLTVGVLDITYGLLASRVYDVNAGEAQIESTIATAVYTEALKYSVGRYRPNSTTDPLSFPSGHTSAVFSVAQSVTDMYGFYGIPFFLYAFYTGLCRISVNAHHVSDVIFGATLGSVVAHGYSVYHLNRPTQKKHGSIRQISLMPYYETRNDFGLELMIKF